MLEVRDLGKRFDIYPNDRSRFLEFLGSRTHHAEHWALRGVGFSVPRGHAFGVIGSNGAGKSTLLRLLAGISEPTEGEVTVRGRMATLLDLGVSFHAAFTGRENIQLTCQLLGMPPEAVDERIPEMIRFAELAEFIDHPVRTYSTGMHLRLGFSVATHSNADLLVIDEVLAVGDQYFQRKCVRRIEALLADGATLVFVSHDLHAVRSLCDEALWLDRGRVRAVGPPREVIDRYLEVDRLRAVVKRPPAPPGLRVVEPGPDVAPAVDAALAPAAPADGAPAGDVPAADAALAPAAPAAEARAKTTPRSARRVPTLPGSPVLPHDPHPKMEDDPHLLDVLARACAVPDADELFHEATGEARTEVDGEDVVVAGTGEARILRVQVLDAQGHERERFRTGESLVVAVTFRTTEPVERPIFGVALFRADGTYLFGPNTRFDGVLDGTFHGVYTFFVHYPRIPLLAGAWRISVAIFDSGHIKPLVWHNQLYGFEVGADVEDHGIVQLPHQWGMLRWHEEG